MLALFTGTKTKGLTVLHTYLLLFFCRFLLRVEGVKIRIIVREITALLGACHQRHLLDHEQLHVEDEGSAAGDGALGIAPS